MAKQVSPHETADCRCGIETDNTEKAQHSEERYSFQPMSKRSGRWIVSCSPGHARAAIAADRKMSSDRKGTRQPIRYFIFISTGSAFGARHLLKIALRRPTPMDP